MDELERVLKDNTPEAIQNFWNKFLNIEELEKQSWFIRIMVKARMWYEESTNFIYNFFKDRIKDKNALEIITLLFGLIMGSISVGYFVNKLYHYYKKSEIELPSDQLLNYINNFSTINNKITILLTKTATEILPDMKSKNANIKNKAFEKYKNQVDNVKNEVSRVIVKNKNFAPFFNLLNNYSKEMTKENIIKLTEKYINDYNNLFNEVNLNLKQSSNIHVKKFILEKINSTMYDISLANSFFKDLNSNKNVVKNKLIFKTRTQNIIMNAQKLIS